jgi:hypothetical protein
MLKGWEVPRRRWGKKKGRERRGNNLVNNEF